VNWTRNAGAAGAAGLLAGAAAVVRFKTERSERAHPPLGRFVEVNGARLHYLDEGQGTPLVLLHGLGSMVEDFVVSALVAQASTRYRVLIFDRPGYGHSSRPRGTRSAFGAVCAYSGRDDVALGRLRYTCCSIRCTQRTRS
jgi:hypothetical protein